MITRLFKYSWVAITLILWSFLTNSSPYPQSPTLVEDSAASQAANTVKVSPIADQASDKRSSEFPMQSPPAAASSQPTKLDDAEPVVEFGWGINKFLLTNGLLYWSAYCRSFGIDAFPGQLGRLPTSGGRTLILAETGQWDCETFWSMAADATGVYYYNNHQEQIEFRPVGSPFVPIVIISLPYTQRPDAMMQVDEQYLYWVSLDQHVMRIPKVGGSIEIMADTGSNPHDLAMGDVWLWDWYQADSLLWYDDLGLYYIRKDCGPLPCSSGQITSAAGGSITIWSHQIFWIENGPPKSIHRHNCSFYGCSNHTEYTAPSDQSWSIGRVAVGGCPDGGDCIFWREGLSEYVGARIRRKPIATGEPDDIAVNLSGYCYDVRTDDQWVYFHLRCSQLARLPFDATALVRDLKADAWEVTQTVQSLENDVPLVADKPTYVRLYGSLLNGPTATSVDAYLYGYRDGISLPGSPLTIVGPNQTLEAGIDQERSTRGDGWLFKLPTSWIQAGVIELRAAIDPYGIIQDPDRSNNELSGMFTFTGYAPACTIFIPVHTHTPKPEISYDSFWKMIDRFTRLWPIPDTWVYTQSEELEEPEFCWKWIFPWVCQGPYELNEGASIGDWFRDDEELLLDINTRAVFSDDPDECDDAGSAVHYIGMVHHEAETGWKAGMGYTDEDILQHASWFKLPVPRIYPPNHWFYPYEGSVMAHELSHNHERKHVDCGNPDDVGYFPYPTDQLDDDIDPTHYGFDVNTQTPIEPGMAADYMSYCHPEWSSDYTYQAMLNHVGTMGLASSISPGTSDLAFAEEVIILSGGVDPANLRGSLNYAWVYPTGSISQKMLGKWQEIAAPAWLLENTQSAQVSYHLRLLDAGGQTLGDYAVTPSHAIPFLENNASLMNESEKNLETGSEDDPFAFLHALPAPGGSVARIELLADETLLASLSPGSAAPTVSIQQPAGGEMITQDLAITWTASDPDENDRLLFNVQYSHDGGETWVSLVQNYPAGDPGSPQILTLASLDGLHGSDGENALVRVAASDGYNTSLAVSAAFTVPDLPPRPYILSPESTQSYPPDMQVQLNGGASDPEQGSIEGGDLTWQVDGKVVASGAEELIYGLAPGSHPVILTAMDDHSQQVSANAALTISRLQIPQVETSPTLNGVCDDPAYANTALRLGQDTGSGQAWVYLARTSDALWACYSGMARMFVNGDNQAVLAIDVNNSRDDSVQADDYAFVVGEDGSFITRAGSGFGQPGPGGLLGQVSASDYHWNAEMRIDVSVLGSWAHLVGLYPLNYRLAPPAVNQIGWPYASELDHPVSWAETVLDILPVISSISPETAVLNSDAFVLTVDGENFIEGAELLWDDEPLITTYISSTSVTVQVPAGRLQTAGYFPLKIQNPSGGHTSSETIFTVVNPVPVMTSLSPEYALSGSSALTLNVDGEAFVDGTVVLWNGDPLPTVRLNSNTLQVLLNAEMLRLVWQIGISVQNPDPGGGVSNSIDFRVRPNRTFLPLLLQ